MDREYSKYCERIQWSLLNWKFGLSDRVELNLLSVLTGKTQFSSWYPYWTFLKAQYINFCFYKCLTTGAFKKVQYGYHDKIVSYQIRQNTFNFNLNNST